MNYEVSKNFRVSENWLGQGLIIKVPTLGIQYDHDALVKGVWKSVLGPGGSAEKSWKSHKCYTNSNSYPSWAEPYIRRINS